MLTLYTVYNDCILTGTVKFDFHFSLTFHLERQFQAWSFMFYSTQLLHRFCWQAQVITGNVNRKPQKSDSFRCHFQERWRMAFRTIRFWWQYRTLSCSKFFVFFLCRISIWVIFRHYFTTASYLVQLSLIWSWQSIDSIEWKWISCTPN